MIIDLLYIYFQIKMIILFIIVVNYYNVMYKLEVRIFIKILK